jgi:hypothetical protein
MKTLPSRRIIALAAAYLVALQALLLPLSVAAGDSLGSSLCVSAAPAGGSQTPASQDGGCPCAGGCGMQCCVHTLAGASHIPALPSRIAIGGIASPTPVAAVFRPADRHPQLARAPPAA